MVKKWESLQDDIRRLYHDEGKPLKEVMHLIKSIHNFQASERSYRTQLQKWGYMKYRTSTTDNPLMGPKRRRVDEDKRRLNQVPDLAPMMSTTGINTTLPPLALPTMATQTQANNAAFQNEGIYSGSIRAYHGKAIFEEWLEQDNNIRSTHNTSSTSHHDFLGNDNSRVDIHDQTTGAGVNAPAFSTPSHLDLNLRDASSTTPLHIAILNCDLHQTKSLLEAGAAVDIKDHRGNEPLHYACQLGQSAMVDLLLRFGADVNAKSKNDDYPLHFALSSTLGVSLVRKLLDKRADPSAQNYVGDTPLHIALDGLALAETSQYTAVKELVKFGADLDLVNSAGLTPFHRLLDQEYPSPSGTQSSVEHFYDLIMVFLDYGADLSKMTPDERTPLEVYLERTDGRWKKWHNKGAVIASNHTLQHFLIKGANLLTPVLEGRPFALVTLRDIATKESHWDYELMDIICRKINTGILDADGSSALLELSRMNASSRSQWRWYHWEKWMESLLTRGADANLRDERGRTPLMIILTSLDMYVPQKLKAVDLLLRYGADPRIGDFFGQYPMIEAAERFVIEDLVKIIRVCKTFEDKGDMSPEQEVGTSECVWMKSWRKAFMEESWGDSKSCIELARPLIPARAAAKIFVSSLTVLAEKHMEKAKGMFEGDPAMIEKRRGYMADILRDCRSEKIGIDIALIDLLLPLC